MKKLFFISIFTFSVLKADCGSILNMYNIDPTIRSIRGWKRTVHNGKLSFYIKNIKKYDKYEVGQCLIKNGFNIDKLTRGIGVKK